MQLNIQARIFILLRCQKSLLKNAWLDVTILNDIYGYKIVRLRCLYILICIKCDIIMNHKLFSNNSVVWQ